MHCPIYIPKTNLHCWTENECSCFPLTNPKFQQQITVFVYASPTIPRFSFFFNLSFLFSFFRYALPTMFVVRSYYVDMMGSWLDCYTIMVWAFYRWQNTWRIIERNPQDLIDETVRKKAKRMELLAGRTATKNNHKHNHNLNIYTNTRIHSYNHLVWIWIIVTL